MNINVESRHSGSAETPFNLKTLRSRPHDLRQSNEVYENRFINSQRHKLENKSACEVMEPGEREREQAWMVKSTCKNNPVGSSGVKCPFS